MAKNTTIKLKPQNAKKIRNALDVSEDKVGAVLKDLRLRRRAQRRAGNADGAEETLGHLDNARAVYDTIIRAKIKAIENSDEVNNILADFKAVNAEVQQARDDIKDLAKN